MKRKDVDTFEKLRAQLESLHNEMSILSKKSPNDAVNEFKLGFVNSMLRQCNAFFDRKYVPFENFDGFAAEKLPSNSDVSFMLSQYLGCAEKFRADNIKFEYGRWIWKIDDGGEKVRTSSPRKLNNK